MSEELEEEFMEVFSKITGAKFVDVTPKKMIAKNCKKLKSGLSFDDLLSNRNSYSKSVKIVEEQMWEFLKKNRTKLTKKEYKIMKDRYRFNKTLEQLGKDWGVTRERIRQIEGLALCKLRNI